MRVGKSRHDFDGKPFDYIFGERLILFDEFEEITSGTVLCDSPHVVFCFHILVELDDVGMMEFLQHFSFVENFLFTSFVHAFDGHELKPFLSTRLEDDGVLAFGLFLVDVIFVHLN